MSTNVLKDTEFCLWNCPEASSVEARPTIEQTRSKLEEHRLPSRYAEDIADTTAFRRAVAQCRNEETDTRCFKWTDGNLYVQVDRLTPMNDGESATMERSLLGVWKQTLLGPQRVRGYDYAMHETLETEYAAAKSTYEYGDIGKMLQAILTKEGIGAYSPRRAGGIYFVPTDSECLDLLDRLEAFCLSLGIRFLRYTVPDSEHHRREVGEAIAAGMEAEVKIHQEAVASYSLTTRPDVFTHRRSLMGQTAALVVRLRQHLNGGAEVYTLQLTTLEQQLQELELDQAAQAPRGRRVLVTG